MSKDLLDGILAKRASEAKPEGEQPEKNPEVKTDDDNKEEPKLDAEQIKAEARKAFLVELGVETEEQLKEKLNTPAKVITLTPEEIKAQEEEKVQKALTFGLENKLFKKDQYDSLQALKAKPARELALAYFKQENPHIPEEKLEAAFSKAYYENDVDVTKDENDETVETPSDLQELGKKRIEADAEKFLKLSGQFVSNAETAYSNHLSTTELKAKNTDVINGVFAAMSHSLTINAGEKYGDAIIDIPQETIDLVKETVLQLEAANPSLNKDQLNANINKLILAEIVYEMAPKIAEHAVRMAKEEYERGQHGLPEGASKLAALKDDDLQQKVIEATKQWKEIGKK